MKLSRRENRLLLVFLSVLGGVLATGLLGVGFSWLSHLKRENHALAGRVTALQTAVDNRALWEARDQWLHQRSQSFRSREDASAALLNHLETCARTGGMNLLGREILDPLNAGDAGTSEDDTYFHNATIRIKVGGSAEKVLSWMHSLQQPELLMGVTGQVIEAGEEFTAEIDVTRSYFEGEN